MTKLPFLGFLFSNVEYLDYFFLFRLIWGRFLGRFLFEFLPIVCGVQNAVVEIVFFCKFCKNSIFRGRELIQKKTAYVCICEFV